MKTIILTHADCDGLCSAALLKSVYPEAEVFFTKPVSLLVDLKFLSKKYDQIFISDIAINKRDSEEIIDFLKTNKSEITWFDHHIAPPTIKKENISCKYISDLDASTSEIVYRNYQNQLPKEKVWLAIYGAIGDYSAESEFVKEWMKNWDVRALYFEVSTLVLGIKEEKFNNYGAKRKIVSALSQGKNPSETPGLVDSAKKAVSKEFELYKIIKKISKVYKNLAYADKIPHFGFRGPSALFAATATGKQVGLSVFTTDRFIDITIRSSNPKIPLNIIAEKSAESVGGSGGGHPTASGCRIPTGTLEKFLEKVNEVLEKYKQRN